MEYTDVQKMKKLGDGMGTVRKQKGLPSVEKRKAWKDCSSKKDLDKREVYIELRKDVARTIRWTIKQMMEQELNNM